MSISHYRHQHHHHHYQQQQQLVASMAVAYALLEDRSWPRVNAWLIGERLRVADYNDEAKLLKVDLEILSSHERKESLRGDGVQWRRQAPNRSLGPQLSVHGIFLDRNLVLSRRKLAPAVAYDLGTGPQIVARPQYFLFQIGELTLLCRKRYVLLYIKTPILEFEISFSIRSRLK